MRQHLLFAVTLFALFAGDARAQSSTFGEEVPYIRTPQSVVDKMLDLAGVGPDDFLIDLGSGDGRIVITAASKRGARGFGVEIDPTLVETSNEAARKAGVADRARFFTRDLFETDIREATVLTMYLLPAVNLQLRPRILELRPGTRVVSHDWDMADWPPDRTLTLDVPEKAIGREKLSRLHLWLVPARLQGLWCGPGGVALQVQQRFQAVQATLGDGAGQQSLVGHIQGRRLQLLGGAGAWDAALDAGGQLQVQAAPAGSRLQPGQRLQPASAGQCPAA